MGGTSHRDFATNRPHPRFGHTSVRPSGLVRPEVCSPEIVARQAASIFLFLSCEQLRARLCELHIGPGFVQPEPAAHDR
jgi:hypothetical protein